MKGRKIMTLASKNIGEGERAEEAAERRQGNFFAFLMVLMIALFIALLASGGMTRGNETRNVFNAMVQTRGCVVADIKYQEASSYRCDYPVAGQYVDAHVMWEEAKKVVDARYDKK